MRKLNIIAILLGLVAIVTTSCSNVDEDERFVYVRPASVSRAVLVEDFTGQRCVNCPNANDVIHQLQEQYGDSNVIAVGIHSGPLGFKGNSRYVGLATTLGDEYYTHFGAEYQPVGMINRHGLVNYTDWPAKVHDALQDTAEVSLKLTTAYDSTSRTASLLVQTTTFDHAVSGNLQVWLVEDSITAMQLMPDGSVNYNYTHNHVLRAAVNGEWGSTVSIPASNSEESTFSYRLDDNNVADNCYFVAFVYDDSGVKQVAKARVITKNN
jgi:hypothetical protein